MTIVNFCLNTNFCLKTIFLFPFLPVSIKLIFLICSWPSLSKAFIIYFGNNRTVYLKFNATTLLSRKGLYEYFIFSFCYFMLFSLIFFNFSFN